MTFVKYQHKDCIIGLYEHCRTVGGNEEIPDWQQRWIHHHSPAHWPLNLVAPRCNYDNLQTVPAPVNHPQTLCFQYTEGEDVKVRVANIIRATRVSLSLYRSKQRTNLQSLFQHLLASHELWKCSLWSLSWIFPGHRIRQHWESNSILLMYMRCLKVILRQL